MPALLPHRVGREGAGVQADAGAQLGVSRRRRLALSVDLLAGAYARARARAEACRLPAAGSDDGPVHGDRGQPEAAGAGLLARRLVGIDDVATEALERLRLSRKVLLLRADARVANQAFFGFPFETHL